MTVEIETCIRNNIAWAKLPRNVKQLLGNSQREYEKMIVEFSIKNQLRYKGNLVRTVRKNEEQYYELMMQHSRTHLMLFPYHLADLVVMEMRTTPFMYYIDMMQDLMTQERSYDSLPNFTAADCVRLLGVGRNQYIDLMNQCRSAKKLFRRKAMRELLPSNPVQMQIEPWWLLHVGSVMEDDVKSCNRDEKDVIDILIDDGAQLCGTLDSAVVHSLYTKGLCYVQVPVLPTDHIIVPPLDNFVMNRVLGDYIETLLYKIFVTIDEQTSLEELSQILSIDVSLVQDAVSVFCRLGFAKKRLTGLENMALHVTWAKHMLLNDDCAMGMSAVSIDLDSDLVAVTPGADDTVPKSALFADDTDNNTGDVLDVVPVCLDTSQIDGECTGKRLGFLFDSTLTAFLMMGNLSNTIKTHAVTLFEVGKLAHESLDNFIDELKKVQSFGEGEAQQYFEHAQTLRQTIQTLRLSHELDLLRCESLCALDVHARQRLLTKNYQLLISMAPLSPEILPISCCKPAHLGPAIAEVNSPWWRLFIYERLGKGPPTVMLSRGCRLRHVPARLLACSTQLLVCTWAHEPAVVSTDHCLLALNDTLMNSSVLLQAYAPNTHPLIVHVPFPLIPANTDDALNTETGLLSAHPDVLRLSASLGLEHACGYATLVRTCASPPASLSPHSPQSQSQSQAHSPPLALHLSACAAAAMDPNTAVSKDPRRCPSNQQAALHTQTYSQWTLFDFVFGLPLFDQTLSAQVCDRIQQAQLFSLERRSGIEQMNKSIAVSLLDFIQTFQPVLEGDNEGEEHVVPLPLHNLAFHDTHTTVIDQNI